MNEPEYYTKGSIDLAISKLIENRAETQLTSIELIKMMSSEEELKGHLLFYTSVLEEILSDQSKLSYVEKEQFLLLHKCLVETHKELNP